MVPQFTGTTLNDSQLAVLRQQIAVAHQRGIKVRYWDLPGWSGRALVTEGLDLLNVDGLAMRLSFDGGMEKLLILLNMKIIYFYSLKPLIISVHAHI